MFVCVCLERESESRGVASEDVMEKSLKIKMKHRKCSQLSLIAVCVCARATELQTEIFSVLTGQLLFIGRIYKAILNKCQCFRHSGACLIYRFHNVLLISFCQHQQKERLLNLMFSRSVISQISPKNCFFGHVWMYQSETVSQHLCAL